MASKKHYYKLADILGTFKYYLIHDNIDIECELDNLIEGICNILSSDNNQFNDEKFRDEIKSKYKERYKEYIEEPREKERQEEINNLLVDNDSFIWNHIDTKLYSPLFPKGGKPLEELPKKYISSKSHRE